MPANLTNAEERRLLDSSIDGTYLALFTADPTEAGTLTAEVAGGSYARQSVTWNPAATDGSNNTTKVPSADIAFPTATADWGTITHVGIMSAATAGTMRWFGPLAVAKTILSGDSISVPAANAVVGLD